MCEKVYLFSITIKVELFRNVNVYLNRNTKCNIFQIICNLGDLGEYLSLKFHMLYQ